MSEILEMAKPFQEEWPDPKPLRSTMPEVEPFNTALLPESLRPWIEDVANRIQCPIDFPAAAAMVVMGSIVGRQIGIRPKARDNWTVTPNLWGAIVGRPGLMKSPALQEPLKPLIKMEEVFAEEFKGIKRHWEAKEIVSKGEKNLLKKEIETAIKKKEDATILAMAALTDSQDEEPTRKRAMTIDSTMEKMGEILAGNPNGVLIFRDELTGFLKGLDKQGQEGARAFYLQAWNGDGRFTFDRIGRGTIDIEAACVSVLGGIQPGPLQAYLQETFRNGAGDDGLLQRFQIVVWPDVSKDWYNVDRLPDMEARDMAYGVFEYLSRLNADHLQASKEDGYIPFLRFEAGAAQELFTEWRTELELRLRSGDELPVFEAHLSKYRSLIPTLALLIHLADFQHGPVGVAALEKACAWGDYLESHARRLYNACASTTEEAGQTLLKQIKKGKLDNPFTARDVYRKGWSGLKTEQEAKATLELLEDHCMVSPHIFQTAGRPKEVYFINPKISEVKNG